MNHLGNAGNLIVVELLERPGRKVKIAPRLGKASRQTLREETRLFDLQVKLPRDAVTKIRRPQRRDRQTACRDDQRSRNETPLIRLDDEAILLANSVHLASAANVDVSIGALAQ